MSIKKELNHKMLIQQENNTKHMEHEEEFGFYMAIAAGNIEEVLQRLEIYKEKSSPASQKVYNGILSQDPIQNAKFHFVILAAMATRFCVDNGLNRELGYNMSDIYIQQADLCKSINQINKLQFDMIIDYTKTMRDTRKNNIYSRTIVKCIDYIHDNLQSKLRISDIADNIGVTPSYLSKLFAKEVNESISSYIKNQKLIASANMLIYSDYPIAEIAGLYNFSSQSHFTNSFQEKYGTTPKKYRDEYSNKTMLT